MSDILLRSPFGWASTSLLPTDLIKLTNWSILLNLARDTTWRSTFTVSKAASREPTICLAERKSLQNQVYMIYRLNDILTVFAI